MSISTVSSLDQLNKLLGKQGKLTVIDFHATWCGPCKMIAPTFEQLSKQYTNVNFVKVDVDEAQEVARKYGVAAMPTFIFIKGSDVVHTVRGAQKAQLASSVEKYSGGGGSGKAVFQGQGHKLGDGTNSSQPIIGDPRGMFNIGSEVKTILALVAVYIFLMVYMS